MLNHPNIVQYYGVEVHRDKVNIFMEYCEGGSLASLLDHGRIEDEMVTQVYTFELLEGLAYLHQSGVVHRDIKPENILLDFNGIIKYVDFGTARTVVGSRTRTVRNQAGNSGGGRRTKKGREMMVQRKG
ncbi:AEL_HP2_G0004990.mRNA.1.CDS.1 [Saccharomyces cerevisiae]|nr:AEL_HP2_G0004990.mRNA.1.CDS.1 [Saccharomyces cerevisiae]CAI6390083.1 AEL_HP2_G0004990.mRNA.1.CDS.1 [Saccharomyces cerevisiae]